MRAALALVLAGVLVAPASFAQILGDQSGIMGGEAGFLRPSGGPAVRIDAMPFTRTVTCSDYTLTGTAPGAGAVTWAASPSGASGACTGTTSWSCVVDVAPDAVGEGVEVITVTQGTLTDTETIGFYVDGEHSCFLAQSYDGAYNAGKADLAAVATWVNLGSSALNVTQATGTAQPTYRTGIVGGQPVVRCDGGDHVAASTASDWTFLHDGNGSTIDAVVAMDSAAATNTITGTSSGSSTNTGFGWRTVATAAASFFVSDGVSLKILMSSANNVFTATTYNHHTVTLAASDTPDATAYINGTSVITGTAAAFSALAPANTLKICANGVGTAHMTGGAFSLLYYASVLTSTQRGINLAVDEWALGGTLPVTP